MPSKAAQSRASSMTAPLTLTPYERRHLATHLLRAGLWDELHWLLKQVDDHGRNLWFAVRESEGAVGEYLEDLKLAWRSALDKSTREDQVLLPYVYSQVRYAIALASIHDISQRILPGLLAALIKYRQMSVEAAIPYARQYSDPIDRATVLRTLAHLAAPPLKEVLISEARQAAEMIRDPFERPLWFLGSSDASVPSQRNQYSEEAIAAALTLDGVECWEAVAKLLPFLSTAQREQLIERARLSLRRSKWVWARFDQLLPILRDLPEVLQQDIAEQTIRRLDDMDERAHWHASWELIGWGTYQTEFTRAYVTAALALYVPALRAGTAPLRLLEMVRRMRQAPGCQSRALIRLAPLLEKPLRENVTAEALDLICKMAEVGAALPRWVDPHANRPIPIPMESPFGTVDVRWAEPQARFAITAVTELLDLVEPSRREIIIRRLAEIVLKSADDQWLKFVIPALAPHVPKDMQRAVLDRIERMATDDGNLLRGTTARPIVIAQIAPWLSEVYLPDALRIARLLRDNRDDRVLSCESIADRLSVCTRILRALPSCPTGAHQTLVLRNGLRAAGLLEQDGEKDGGYYLAGTPGDAGWSANEASKELIETLIKIVPILPRNEREIALEWLSFVIPRSPIQAFNAISWPEEHQASLERALRLRDHAEDNSPNSSFAQAAGATTDWTEDDFDHAFNDLFEDSGNFDENVVRRRKDAVFTLTRYSESLSPAARIRLWSRALHSGASRGRRALFGIIDDFYPLMYQLSAQLDPKMVHEIVREGLLCWP